MAKDPMSVAFAEAREAERRGEVPIGAALTRDGDVIAQRRQPHAGRRRPDRPRGNAGDPRGRAARSARRA